ncbi:MULTISPECIES: hypothetical protein [unclassified Mycobacterium]|uniref:hypothetical protein n=1 Tax=unclassified Mycobacterium TaxID=2642494 RepID=UPI0007FC8901|nr:MULTISPECIES: hypothetical protein [unclassified Mycobacterium]OBG71343.1 hypothetical protein A5700_12285 [Mycobacterium sp. E1214]OBH31609.1 hypothetical protein A5693_15950 [Mycobacterium sp. E1319]
MTTIVQLRPPAPNSQWTDEALQQAAELVEFQRERVTQVGDNETSLMALAFGVEHLISDGTERQIEYLAGALAIAVRKLAVRCTR